MNMHISHTHKMLLLAFNQDILGLFPHAKTIQFNGENFIVLPHGNDEARLLRNVGISVPAPITEYYGWPGPYKPFDVQIRTSAMLTMNARAFVLNQMGTGKTSSALWAWDYLRRNNLTKKLLVVCPLSTVRFVWAREAMKLFHNIKIAVLDGTKERRLRELKSDADIYIINHDGIKVISKELALRGDLDCVVVDEVSAYRNANADRSKVLLKLTQARRWVWGMTGSPTPTSPTDAYGLAKLITPITAPRSFSHFRGQTMVQVNAFKWLPRSDAAEVVSKVLQPSVCFTLEDAVELPQMIEQTLDVEQGVRQTKVFKGMAEHMAVLLKEGQLTAANGGVCLSKLLQVSCGYVYTDSGKVATLDNKERLQLMLETIDGSRGKVIVFAPFIHAVNGISAFLAHEGLDFRVITGSTSSSERDEIFRLFQQTDHIDVIVAHPQCMAHGITLTAADTIIWFSPTTSLEIYEQANARIRRAGQTRKQQIFMLQGTSAERRVYSRLRQKRDVQTSILDLIQGLGEETL